MKKMYLVVSCIIDVGIIAELCAAAMMLFTHAAFLLLTGKGVQIFPVLEFVLGILIYAPSDLFFSDLKKKTRLYRIGRKELYVLR